MICKALDEFFLAWRLPAWYHGYRNPEDKGDLNMVKETIRDRIRGCLLGGAAGDALGYTVEFQMVGTIFDKYGKGGITRYECHPQTGKALISDDTQMTLFTANGLLVGDTQACIEGLRIKPRQYVAEAYQDWLYTQRCVHQERDEMEQVSWLCDVPELHSRRAPGNTCLMALHHAKRRYHVTDFIARSNNNSKGCGGVMRVAPVGISMQGDMEQIDLEAAQIAAITHGHSLGYMPAAVLSHIIHRLVYPQKPMTLKEIVLEAKETCEKLFRGDEHLLELTGLIDAAIALSENDKRDVENILTLGAGWVAEETLAIAIYCSLKYSHDFSAGIIAAVNHSGDSDSTGAVTGNILGALVGYEAIGDQWKTDLECADVILEMADDLCRMATEEFDVEQDPVWKRKYVDMHWK